LDILFGGNRQRIAPEVEDEDDHSDDDHSMDDDDDVRSW
jgi:hypothetical protein